MGQLRYDPSTSFEIEDRMLAHLRLVIMTKLRRQESFMLQSPHRDVGWVSVWIHPSVPVGFRFFGSRTPAIDRELAEAWITEASGSDGLTLTSRS